MLLLRISTIRFFVIKQQNNVRATDKATSDIFARSRFSRFLRFSRPCSFFLPSARGRVRRCDIRKYVIKIEAARRDARREILTTNCLIWHIAIALSPATNDSFAAIFRLC